MYILVVNAGSSSLKFQLVDGNKSFKALYKGIADGIGSKSCFFKIKVDNNETRVKKVFKSHKEALRHALKVMIDLNVIQDLKQIDAIGHRVVHGGEHYKEATRITPTVKKTIKKLFELAPLHNPPNLEGIEACEKLLPGKPNIAIFDTAFHQTIPEKAYMYAIPKQYYKKYKIRKYGFHGTSHKYVADQTYKLLKTRKAKIIICHLGNGSSISAIKNGKCIDTSMGFTPLEGVPMGTRSGSIDPAIPLFLIDAEKKNANAIDHILNKKSGLLGFSGKSNDLRDIWKLARNKNKIGLKTIDFLAYRIALQIGSYIAALNGVDAITFTAGIGQHAWYLRRDIAKYLEFTGVKLDSPHNKANKVSIHKKNSKVKVLVIPTNEGLQIAKEVKKVMKARKKA